MHTFITFLWAAAATCIALMNKIAPQKDYYPTWALGVCGMATIILW